MPCSRHQLDHPSQRRGVQHPAGGVAGRVHPQQGRRRVQPVEIVGTVDQHGVGAHQGGADGVGGVGQWRQADDGVRAEVEVQGQGADRLLEPDDRQHRLQRHRRDAVGAVEPVGVGLPQVGAADGERVAGRVALVHQGALRHRGRRVDRRSDRQVDHRTVERGRATPNLRHPGLHRHREPVGEPGARVGQWSCSCGSRAATIGWSWSISPILAAPPGEPISSKKPTLAV